MRVFVTGATGFIGSATVRELLQAGHSVLGLVRSEASAAALAAAGGEPHRGSLQDLDSLRAGAAACDGVIHTGFIHDFTNMQASGVADRLAIDAMGETLAGSDRPFVVTSALAHFEPGQLATEDQPAKPDARSSHRIASESAALAWARRQVRVSLLRLSVSVHGDGDHAFVPALIGIARAKGVSGYVGDGSNRWPAVHRLDAARLYRLALEKGTAGAVYHGVGEQAVPLKAIAEVIARRLQLPLVSVAPADSASHFGWLAHFVDLDCPASSDMTQQQLGWQPQQPTLLADLDRPAYFA